MKPHAIYLLLGLTSIGCAVSPACAQFQCAPGQRCIIRPAPAAPLAASQPAAASQPRYPDQAHQWQQWAQQVAREQQALREQLAALTAAAKSQPAAPDLSADIAALNEAAERDHARLVVLERDSQAHAKALAALAETTGHSQAADERHAKIFADVQARLEKITVNRTEDGSKSPATKSDASDFAPSAAWWWDFAGNAGYVVASAFGLSIPATIGAFLWRAAGRAVNDRLTRRGTSSPAPTLPAATAETSEPSSSPPAAEVIRETDFVPIEQHAFENDYEECRALFARKFPGMVNALENFDGMLKIHHASKQVKKP